MSDSVARLTAFTSKVGEPGGTMRLGGPPFWAVLIRWKLTTGRVFVSRVLRATRPPGTLIAMTTFPVSCIDSGLDQRDGGRDENERRIR